MLGSEGLKPASLEEAEQPDSRALRIESFADWVGVRASAETAEIDSSRVLIDPSEEPILHPDGKVEVLLSDGVRLNLTTEVHGKPSGWTIFSWHGTPGSSIAPSIRPGKLHSLGVREIRIARPGYDDSTRYEGYSIADCATFLEAAARAYNVTECSVTGRSGGGPPALAGAALLPNLVVNAAVFSGAAPPGAVWNWEKGLSKGNVEEFTAAQEDPEKLAATFERIAEASKGDREAVLQDIEDDMSAADRLYLRDRAIRDAIAKAHAEGMKNGHWGRYDDVMAAQKPWMFDPRKMRIPVLLAHGGQDTFVLPAEYHWLLDNIPQAVGYYDPDVGHMNTLELVPYFFALLRDHKGSFETKPPISYRSIIRGASDVKLNKLWPDTRRM